MAMTKCRECGKEVSTQASNCPHCGVANPGRALGLSSGALGCLAVLGVVAVVTVIGSIGGGSGSSSSRRVTLDPQDAKAMAALQHRRRLQADSQLATLSQAQIVQLKDSVLLFLAHWTDSSSDLARRATVVKEQQRRAVRHKAEQQLSAARQKVEQRALRTEQQRRAAEARLPRIVASAGKFKFDNGTPCTKGTEERIQSLLSSHPGWGDSDLLRVACGSLWIGMTQAQLTESWAAPERVNRTVYPGGVHEQWIYGDTYVYVEDGVVTSYQTSR